MTLLGLNNDNQNQKNNQSNNKMDYLSDYDEHTQRQLEQKQNLRQQKSKNKRTIRSLILLLILSFGITAFYVYKNNDEVALLIDDVTVNLGLANETVRENELMLRQKLARSSEMMVVSMRKDVLIDNDESNDDQTSFAFANGITQRELDLVVKRRLSTLSNMSETEIKAEIDSMLDLNFAEYTQLEVIYTFTNLMKDISEFNLMKDNIPDTGLTLGQIKSLDSKNAIFKDFKNEIERNSRRDLALNLSVQENYTKRELEQYFDIYNFTDSDLSKIKDAVLSYQGNLNPQDLVDVLEDVTTLTSISKISNIFHIRSKIDIINKIDDYNKNQLLDFAKMFLVFDSETDYVFYEVSVDDVLIHQTGLIQPEKMTSSSDELLSPLADGTYEADVVIIFVDPDTRKETARVPVGTINVTAKKQI